MAPLRHLRRKIYLWVVAFLTVSEAFRPATRNRWQHPSGQNGKLFMRQKHKDHSMPSKCLYQFPVGNDDNIAEKRSVDDFCSQRRLFVGLGVAAVASTWDSQPSRAEGTLGTIVAKLKEARGQLDPIPKLIKEEKWDTIRNILVTPPLSDCWSKTSKLLEKYAAAIGDELPDGDELAALELKEDAAYHLRFLDMAVYNNVFNPIKTEGETGATKELIRSYYEDPINEYKQTIKIFNDLIDLSSGSP